MHATTDPAREVSDIFKRFVAAKGDQAGDRHIASVMGVEAWSRDFFEIMFSITERLDLIAYCLDDMGFDDDHKSDMLHHIEGLRSIFTKPVFSRKWSDPAGGLSILKEPHLAAVTMVSPQLRNLISYPKLTEDEVAEVVEQIDTLLVWLRDHQLHEHDFIRSALIAGLEIFRTRLLRIGWLGWGHSITSLKEVVAAYLALERTNPNAATSPDAAAALKILGNVLLKFWEVTGKAVEVNDRVGLGVSVYGAFSLARDTGIIGLLTKQ